MSFIKLLGFWIDPYIDMNFEGSSCDTFDIRNLEQHVPRNSISLHFGHTFADSVILTATCIWAWSVLGLGVFAGTITVQRDIIKIQNRHTKFQNRTIRETNYISCHTMRLLKDVCSSGKGLSPSVSVYTADVFIHDPKAWIMTVQSMDSIASFVFS